MALQLALTVLLARGLSQNDYGIYFVLLSAIVVFATVGTLGLDQIVVRFVSADLGSGDKFSAKTVIIKCATGVSASAVVVGLLLLPAAGLFFNSNPEYQVNDDVIYLTAGWLFLATCQRHIAETFRGMDDIRLATLLGGVRNNGIINSVLICGGVLALWGLNELTLTSVILVMATSALIVVCLGCTLLIVELRSWRAPSVRTPRSFTMLLHEAWPLSIAAQILVLSSMGSMWIAGALLPPEEVAQFGVAMRCVAVLLAPMAIMVAILPPVVSRLFVKGDFPTLEYLLRGTATVTVLIGGTAYAALLFFGERGTSLIFGSEYQAAYPVLLILCAGQVANLATGGWQILLPMSGQRRTVLLLAIVSVTVQLGLSVWWGLQFGVTGIAAGVCVSTVVTNGLGALAAKRMTGISTWASVSPKPMLAASRQLGEKFVLINTKSA